MLRAAPFQAVTQGSRSFVKDPHPAGSLLPTPSGIVFITAHWSHVVTGLQLTTGHLGSLPMRPRKGSRVGHDTHVLYKPRPGSPGGGGGLDSWAELGSVSSPPPSGVCPWAGPSLPPCTAETLLN